MDCIDGGRASAGSGGVEAPDLKNSGGEGDGAADRGGGVCVARTSAAAPAAASALLS